MQKFGNRIPPLHLHNLCIIGKLRCCRSMFEGVWSSTEVPLHMETAFENTFMLIL